MFLNQRAPLREAKWVELLQLNGTLISVQFDNVLKCQSSECNHFWPNVFNVLAHGVYIRITVLWIINLNLNIEYQKD